jgi:hypothetical protein
MIRVVCTCGRAFKAEDRHAGKQTKCPECGAGLTIGPAPISTSTGGDAKEAPPWWYPNDPAAQVERATAPTRSGSDPGTDAVNTMVLPPHGAKPQSSSQSLPAGASTSAQVSAPKASVGAQMQVPGHPSFPIKKTWVIASGSIGLLVLAVGVTLWLRPRYRLRRAELSCTSRMQWPRVRSRRQRCQAANQRLRRTRSPAHRPATPRATLRHPGRKSKSPDTPSQPPRVPFGACAYSFRFIFIPRVTAEKSGSG